VAVGAGAPDSLRRALRLLGRDILSVDAAAARLHDGGLTSGVLHPATVLLAAEWFGVDPSAALIELAPGHELVVPLGREAGIRQVTLLIQRRGIAPSRSSPPNFTCRGRPFAGSSTRTPASAGTAGTRGRARTPAGTSSATAPGACSPLARRRSTTCTTAWPPC